MVNERAGTTRAWPLVVPDILWRCLDWQRACDAEILDGVEWSGRASIFALVVWRDHLVSHSARSGLTTSSPIRRRKPKTKGHEMNSDKSETHQTGNAEAGFGAAPFLGVISNLFALDKLPVLLCFVCQPIIHRSLVARLQIRKFRLDLRLRLIRMSMARCKTVIVCLQRGYLTGNEPNLRTNRVLWRVGVHHPVEVINIFLERFHKVNVAMTASQRPSAATAAENAAVSARKETNYHEL